MFNYVCVRVCFCVPDCLRVLVYKERSKGQRERGQLTLGDICGLELLQCFEGVSYALSLLCLTQSFTLGFDSRENLLAWDARIRYSLGEGEKPLLHTDPPEYFSMDPAVYTSYRNTYFQLITGNNSLVISDFV